MTTIEDDLTTGIDTMFKAHASCVSCEAFDEFRIDPASMSHEAFVRAAVAHFTGIGWTCGRSPLCPRCTHAAWEH
jgi:hypothetical protein